MTRRPKIAIAAALEYPDPGRPMFKSKTLLFVDRALCQWVSRGGGLPFLIPVATGRELAETLALGARFSGSLAPKAVEMRRHRTIAPIARAVR